MSFADGGPKIINTMSSTEKFRTLKQIVRLTKAHNPPENEKRSHIYGEARKKANSFALSRTYEMATQ